MLDLILVADFFVVGSFLIFSKISVYVLRVLGLLAAIYSHYSF